MRLPIPCLAALLTLTALPVWAENRGVAVTNSTYTHAEPVAGAEAAFVAEAMRSAGLRTVSGENLAAEDLRKAVSDLLRPDDQPGIRLVLLTGRFLHDGRDSWLMGVDAENPDPFSLALGGVSLGTIMGQIDDAQPGAILVLGHDDKTMEHGQGVQDGMGRLNPPEGVTVLTGPADSASAAAAALLVAGVSVDAVLQADPDLKMVEGGDRALMLLPSDTTPVHLEGERDLWAKAAADDQAASYQNYLDRFPQGSYSAAAKTRLSQLSAASSDRDAWADAAALNTRPAYQAYLSRFPSGQYAEPARRRLDELTAAPVTAPTPAPSVQPVRSAAQQAEAQLRLSRSDRQQIQRNLNALNYGTGGVDGVLGSRSRQAIGQWQRANGYGVTSYLTAEQVQDLRRQAAAQQQSRESSDRSYWEQTGAKGGAGNLRAYLDRYPNGIYAERAQNRLHQINGQQGDTRSQRDARAYDNARQQHTVQAYETYLRNWPKGEYVKQARAQRDALRRGRGGLNSNNILDLDPEKIIRELLK